MSILKTKYFTMVDSSETDNKGQNYPDVMTFPINRFQYSAIPIEITINQFVKEKLPVYLYTVYSTVDYDDIILWLNNKESSNELIIGEKLILPDKRDIDAFYLKFIK